LRFANSAELKPNISARDQHVIAKDLLQLFIQNLSQLFGQPLTQAFLVIPMPQA
jgi:hypothetical protein